MTHTTPRFHAATRAVRAAIDCDPAHGAVTPSLVLSANFSFAGFGRKRAYDYTRSGNPTRDALACALAELEGGAGAVVTSSGMAAVALVAQSLLPHGARVVLAHDAYGGTWRLFDALASRGTIQLALADLTRGSPRFETGTALVWVETPSNPLLRITDLDAVVAAARAAGALVVVDNTFLSPALQQPLAHGADVVVHSTTKYVNGHSDVVGGAVVARDAAVCERLAWWANATGVAGSPFDALLTLRGLRTLDARLAVHERNAAALVALLDGHDAVAAAHWPGLATHPGHDVARRQQSGYGGMLSFELAGGEPAVRALLDGLACFTLAESLGGVESLVAHPATMTHASMSPAARAVAGIGPGLVRVSAGIEHADDLVADLAAGLERALVAGARRRWA